MALTNDTLMLRSRSMSKTDIKFNFAAHFIVTITVFVMGFMIFLSSNALAADECPSGLDSRFDETGQIYCLDSAGNYCSPEGVLFDELGNAHCRETYIVDFPEEGEETTGTAAGGSLEFVPPDQARTDHFCTDSNGNQVAVAVDVNCDESEDNVITAYLNGILNFLAGGVGLVVIVMVAAGGVQYMMAGGNPQATQAALKRMTDAIVGLLFFIFLYAILMWVIPGGWL